MSSNFSSTKAYHSSFKRDEAEKSRTSKTQSLLESSSGASTSARKHSTTSKHSSMSSSKDSTRSSSRASARTSLKHSPKSSHKQKYNSALLEIGANGQSHENLSQLSPPATRLYGASPVRSTPHYTTSSDPMTEAEYQAHMQAVLYAIDAQLGLDNTQMDSDDDQLVQYETQLELDEDESERI